MVESGSFFTSRVLRLRRGSTFDLPFFVPVYRPGSTVFGLDAWDGEPRIRGCMVNAFFLYKDRALRGAFGQGLTLKEHIGFDGLLVTDSGAFQGFKGPLLLSNKKIVSFQDMIRTDIAAPLDLVTPPGDNRSIATRKLEATQKRIREGLKVAEHCILAGVQQGGRFLDLRRKSVEELVAMDIEYLAIGSLVPFFNKNHDLQFVGKVLQEARSIVGPHIPMHVYGAGDPVEIPFMVRLGADIFDSSSYAHFAESGYYMTPYGSLNDPGPILAGEFTCPCSVCANDDIQTVFTDVEKLKTHNLWTICRVVDDLRTTRDRDALDTMLASILSIHRTWFPTSALAASWESLDV